MSKIVLSTVRKIKAHNAIVRLKQSGVNSKVRRRALELKMSKQ
jgi:hypothetical protein